jgi:uncharacterized protein YlxP (DUF503 family)
MVKQLKQRRKKYNPIKQRRKNLRKFDLTIAEYDQMAVEQSNCCAICADHQTGNRRLAVDHDHETGEVRGFSATAATWH